MMHIAVDLEGVLANVEDMLIWLYNVRNDTNYTVNDITAWNFEENPKFQIPEKEIFDDTCYIWNTYWKHIKPTEENLAENMRTLNKKHIVDIVTSAIVVDRCEDGEDKIKSWLKNHLIPYRKFVHVDAGQSKINLNYDAYIDDRPGLAVEVEKQKKIAMLYDRPWNRNLRESAFIKRVANFSEVNNYLRN